MDHPTEPNRTTDPQVDDGSDDEIDSILDDLQTAYREGEEAHGYTMFDMDEYLDSEASLKAAFHALWLCYKEKRVLSIDEAVDADLRKLAEKIYNDKQNDLFGSEDG